MKMVFIILAMGCGGVTPAQPSIEPERTANNLDAALGVDAPNDGSTQGCRGLLDCPWGHHCASLGGSCVEAECHDASPDNTLLERSCPQGQVCEFEDSMAVNWGAGYCAPEGTP